MPTNPSPSSKTKTNIKKTPSSKASTSPKSQTIKTSPTARTTPSKSKSPTRSRTSKTSSKMSSIENSLDQFADTATKTIVKKITPGVTAASKKISSTSRKVGASVISAADAIEHEVDKSLPNDVGSDLLLDFQFDQKVSRLFIFRPLRLIIQLPIMYFWSIWIIIVSVVHYIYMFLLGKRNASLRDDQARYSRHIYKWKSYTGGLTNKRPKIIED